MEAASFLLNRFYANPNSFKVVAKSDASPVTDADYACHQLFLQTLSSLKLQLPVLSEESSVAEMQEFEHQKSTAYWLIDPLDGTAGFVKGTGEFAVNLALMMNGHVIAGWVAWPQQELVCWSILGQKPLRGQFFFGQKSGPEALIRRERLNHAAAPLVVTSAGEGKTSAILIAHLQPYLPQLEYFPSGAATKFCLLFAGQADFYPRLGRTGLWDLAAGHALLKSRGGEIYTLDGKPLEYWPRQSLYNPYFLAVASAQHELVPHLIEAMSQYSAPIE